jgi:acyl carrier protein
VDDATIREKLVRCFSAVFPDLNPDEIESANIENTSGWDSIAHVTVLTLIGEEFGINIDFDRFSGAASFEAFVAQLRESASIH